MDELQWRCGKCNRKYASLTGLVKVKLVDTDTNPKEEHGFTMKCSCGYVFHKDKWFVQDEFIIYDKKRKVALVEVSTVDLELQHFGYWYESMVFVKQSFTGVDVYCNYQKRDKTKEDAIETHNKIVDDLRQGLFKIREDTERGYEVVIDYERK